MRHESSTNADLTISAPSCELCLSYAPLSDLCFAANAFERPKVAEAQGTDFWILDLVFPFNLTSPISHNPTFSLQHPSFTCTSVASEFRMPLNYSKWDQLEVRGNLGPGARSVLLP